MDTLKRSTLTKIFIIAAAMMMFAFVAIGEVRADTSGDWYLTSSKTLTQNHKGRFVIARPGITLDCAGKWVYKGDTSYSSGIVIPSTNAGIAIGNVTIKNCNVTGYTSQGISVTGTPNVRLESNLLGNNRDGIYSYNNTGLQLYYNYALANTRRGFYFNGSSSAIGGRIDTMSNVSEANGGDGFYSYYAHVELLDSESYDNSGCGFNSKYADNIYCGYSNAYANLGDGINVANSNDFLIDFCRVTCNEESGLRIYKSDNGRIYGNEGYDNNYYDLEFVSTDNIDMYDNDFEHVYW